MIEVHHLVKRFGPKTVLRNLEFQVAPGEFVALLGPNGAGKTTFIRILGTALSIIFSIGASLALGGSALGPILVVLLVFFPYMAVRYWQIFWAYNQGTNLVASLGGGVIAKITEFATLVGLAVVGGFAPSIVRLAVAWKPAFTTMVQGKAATTTIDQKLTATSP